MAAIMLAASIAWAMHDTRGLRPVASQLAMLRARAEVPPAALEVRDERRARDRSDPVVLRASRLPAGTYALAVDPGSRGAVRVHVGRTDLVIARWEVGQPPLVLGFPVDVHSVTVRAEAGADIRDARLSATLVQAVSPGQALRAVRYGRTNAFFLDDSSYVEPNGFWTRGEETTTVVFAPPDAGDWRLLLQAGAVPTAVDVSTGDANAWERLEFSPGQQRPVTPPARDGGIERVVTIRTGAWFRPSDRNPQDKDMRRLGVFGIVPD
jgi:hypothetical protein